MTARIETVPLIGSHNACSHCISPLQTFRAMGCEFAPWLRVVEDEIMNKPVVVGQIQGHTAYPPSDEITRLVLVATVSSMSSSKATGRCSSWRCSFLQGCARATRVFHEAGEEFLQSPNIPPYMFLGLKIHNSIYLPLLPDTVQKIYIPIISSDTIVVTKDAAELADVLRAEPGLKHKISAIREKTETGIKKATEKVEEFIKA